MNYEEFKQEIIDRIRDFLPERYAEAEISVHSVVKNNDRKLDGLVILRDGSNIAPNIYLNDYYGQLEEGRPMESILGEIAEIRTGMGMDQIFDISNITDFENVRERINCRLVNAIQNADYLSDKPHTLLDDLAVTYHIEIGKQGECTMSSPVTNRLMERYGIDTKELHSIALANMETLSSPSFKGMSEMLRELVPFDMMPEEVSGEASFLAEKSMFDIPAEEAMYVLTNKDKFYGAAAILNKKIMDDITGKLGKDFYILPSSVHEVIIVPKTEDMNFRMLESMVRDVNGTQVSPAERLSDHVYGYDGKAHALFRADKFPERFEEKKPSISDALKIPLPDTGSRAVKVPVAGDGAR